MSPPMRGRGLKYEEKDEPNRRIQVAPYAGAWIDIIQNNNTYAQFIVAPYVGRGLKHEYSGWSR